MAAAGDDAREVIAKVRVILDENRRNILLATGYIKDGAADLSVGMQQVRKHPWKLIHRPTDDEIALANLYDSIDVLVRNARAVRELAAAVDAIVETEGPSELKDRISAELDELEKARAQLRDALEKRLGGDGEKR